MQKEIQSSIEIFCSYSHKDKPLRLKFEPIVTNLKRQNQIQLWNDNELAAGSDWAGEIDQHLNSADIIVLLVSSDFLASDYCYEKEMRRAMERESKKEAVVVPVIVRPCDWHDAPFGKLQALPTGGKAVTTWKNRDEAWTSISLALKETIRAVYIRKNEQLMKADAEEARSIYQAIMKDAQTNRMERIKVMSELQAKIFSITQDIQNRPRTVDSAFNNMDQYIKGD